MKNKLLISFSLLSILSFMGCKKSFLDKPSLNSPTLDNYYTTPSQVYAATGFLYNQPWYNFLDKAFHCIGEVYSGNMLTSAGDPNYGFNSFVYFTVSSTEGQLLNAWQSCYKVAGNATVLMNTLQQKKDATSDGDLIAALNRGIAEARFMRAAAYFNIARMWGDVPIVTDPVTLAASGNYNVPRYFQKDVLRFALEDFKAAEAGLPADPYQPGRVTKYSAKGMEAKIYLYRGDYDSAATKANEVIQSGKYSLFANYGAMFTDPRNNNNSESMFALQWLGAGGYSYANGIQAYAAPGPLLGPDFGTGYSSVIPTIDLLNTYEPGDKRKAWSVMQQGFHRADWKNANFPGGFTYDTSWVSSSDDPFKIKTGTRTNSLKYVVGPKSTGFSFTTQGSNDMNVYLLRYADVLLIYAEAKLGTAASTTDASALAAYNAVRTRAGLAERASLTKDQIMHERRVELAFEGDYWFDISRQGFTKAKAILEAQERGTYNFNGQVSHIGVTVASAAKLFLPIPASEIIQDPELDKPAVPYY